QIQQLQEAAVDVADNVERPPLEATDPARLEVVVHVRPRRRLAFGRRAPADVRPLLSLPALPAAAHLTAYPLRCQQATGCAARAHPIQWRHTPYGYMSRGGAPRPEVDSHERHGQHDTGTEDGRSGRPAARDRKGVE